MERKLLSWQPQPDATTKIQAPLPFKESVSLQEYVEREVPEALARLSGLYGITPPKVKVFHDYREFWNAVCDLNARRHGRIVEAAANCGIPYEEEKRRILKRVFEDFQMPIEMQDAGILGPIGICEEASIPGAGCDAIIWIDSSSKDGLRDAVVAEAGHAVTKKVQKLLGVKISKEVDETLEYVHKMLMKRPEERDSFRDEVRLQGPSLELAASLFDKFGGHEKAGEMFLIACERFRDEDSLRDLAVILATTPNICIGDEWATRTFEWFIRRTSEQEKQTPGYLKKLAGEKRQLLAEKNA